MENEDEFLTVSEVAEWIRVHRRTVAKLIKEGKIPALRIGGEKYRSYYRIKRGDIINFINNLEVKG